VVKPSFSAPPSAVTVVDAVVSPLMDVWFLHWRGWNGTRVWNDRSQFLVGDVDSAANRDGVVVGVYVAVHVSTREEILVDEHRSHLVFVYVDDNLLFGERGPAVADQHRRFDHGDDLYQQHAWIQNSIFEVQHEDEDLHVRDLQYSVISSLKIVS